MASLTMNLPGIGLTTLRGIGSNLAGGVDHGGKFANWQASLFADVDAVNRQSDGRRAATWEYHRYPVVSVELQHISPSVLSGGVGSIDMYEAAQRFAFEATYIGRTFDLAVEDGVTAARLCELAPGTEATVTLADPAARLYTLTLTARAVDTLAPFGNVFPGLKR